MNNFNYVNLTPFKWYVRENFPFIEAEFDAMTNWDLFCKLGKEINKIIDSQNLVGEQAEKLTNAFNALKDYVDNYFDNLDVQEEINQKLDEMASDGTLSNLINQELQDILNDVTTDITNIKGRLDLLEADKIVAIGDSYATGSSAGQQFATDGWAERLKTLLGMTSENFQWYGEGGAGLIAQGHNGHNFLELLQANINNITNKDKVKYFILAGGYNDASYQLSNLWTALQNFITYVKTQFPNAKILIGMIGNDSSITTAGTTKRSNLHEVVLYIYKKCNQYGACYMTGIENVLHNYDVMSSDNIHPTADGYKELAYAMLQILLCGSIEPCYRYESSSISGNNVSSSTISLRQKLVGNQTIMDINGLCNFTENVSISSPDTEFVIGTLSKSKYYRRVNEYPIMSTPVIVTKSDDTRFVTNATLRINNSNELCAMLQNVDVPISVKKISFYRNMVTLSNSVC